MQKKMSVKIKKLFLDFEEEIFDVGVLRMTQNIPHHQLFFRINQLNAFHFHRKSDFELETTDGIFAFPRYTAFDPMSQNHFIILANLSCHYTRKTPIIGLFDDIEEKYLFSEDIDFIIFSKEGGNEFSKISLPLEFLSPMECTAVASGDEFYPIILHYDE